jgi:PAP2 superfamily C-terminal
MDTVAKRYRRCLSDKHFWATLGFSLFLLIGSLIINFYAGTYATQRESNPVSDIILSNIRVYDVDAIFVYGSIAFWFFIGFICFYQPQKAPFTLKSIALFTAIRAVFITLTHIGPFPTHVDIDPTSFISYFTFGGDLFFSGHTGLPFLMALVFWDTKALRIGFIICSIIFGVVVLLGHLHYSIDVAAAFFITYSIFHIAEWLFKRDRKLFFECT